MFRLINVDTGQDYMLDEARLRQVLRSESASWKGGACSPGYALSIDADELVACFYDAHLRGGPRYKVFKIVQEWE